MVPRGVDHRARLARRVGLEGERHEVSHEGVEVALGEPAVTHRGDDRRCGWPVGHLKMQPGLQGHDSVVHAVPVRHGHAAIAPILLEDRREEPRILDAVDAVEAVVRDHHHPRSRLRHAQFERSQVQLAESLLIDDRVRGVADALVLVADEVLGAGAHPLPLHTLDEGRPEAAAQERVLGVVLEVAAAERRALEIEPGGENDPDAERLRFLADRRADLANESRVPAWRRAPTPTGNTWRARWSGPVRQSRSCAGRWARQRARRRGWPVAGRPAC